MSDQTTPSGGHAQDTELKDSNPNAGGPERAAGGMGISSERVGPTGRGQESTDGESDTSGGTSGDLVAPTRTHPSSRQRRAAPRGPRAKADYPSKDPRSD